MAELVNCCYLALISNIALSAWENLANLKWWEILLVLGGLGLLWALKSAFGGGDDYPTAGFGGGGGSGGG